MSSSTPHLQPSTGTADSRGMKDEVSKKINGLDDVVSPSRKNDEPVYSDFLNSPTLTLKAGSSPDHTFQIHRDLLRLRNESIYSACTSNSFSEATLGTYTFSDTMAETVVRFVQWCYTGNYSSAVSLKSSNLKREPDAPDFALGVETWGQSTPGSRTFLSHIRLYIFAATYLIPELKSFVFARITAQLRNMGKPTAIQQQQRLIQLLDLAFAYLAGTDGLLKWLGRYVAYSLDELRSRPEFLELLEHGTLAREIISSVGPRLKAPWEESESPMADHSETSTTSTAGAAKRKRDSQTSQTSLAATASSAPSFLKPQTMAVSPPVRAPIQPMPTQPTQPNFFQR
ncbi:MAG: hypothetical protein M1819_004335 [Sarea resinae]|nr:MAG: hypothetical protein M1819_004335 [Sarea resinae]